MELQEFFTKEAWANINKFADEQGKPVMGVAVETLNGAWQTKTMDMKEVTQAIEASHPKDEEVPIVDEFEAIFHENARAYNSLLKGGITDIETLLTKTEEDLLSIPRCGQGSVDFIVEKLWETKGLTLKRSSEPEPEPEIEEEEEEELEIESYHLNLMDIKDDTKTAVAYAKAKELYAKAWSITQDESKDYMLKVIMPLMKDKHDVSELKSVFCEHFPATHEQMARLSDFESDPAKLSVITNEIVGIELFRLNIEQAEEVLSHLEKPAFEESEDLFSEDF